jgi:uncharacterized membrane protein
MAWWWWLMDTSDYVPRHLCGNWPDDLRRASQVFDGLIFAAFVLIPLCAVALWRQRRNAMGGMWRLLVLAAFVLTCGVTHLNEILVFDWPAYRWFIFWKLITAGCAWAFVLVFPHWWRTLSRLGDRSREVHEQRDRAQHELVLKEIALADLRNANAHLESFNRELGARLELLEAEIHRRLWREDNRELLDGFVAELRQIAARHRGHPNGGR